MWNGNKKSFWLIIIKFFLIKIILLLLLLLMRMILVEMNSGWLPLYWLSEQSQLHTHTQNITTHTQNLIPIHRKISDSVLYGQSIGRFNIFPDKQTKKKKSKQNHSIRKLFFKRIQINQPTKLTIITSDCRLQTDFTSKKFHFILIN